MRLKKCTYEPHHKQDKQIFVAHTLSRAELPNTGDEFQVEIVQVAESELLQTDMQTIWASTNKDWEGNVSTT